MGARHWLGHQLSPNQQPGKSVRKIPRVSRTFDVGYKNSEDRISEMDKLECYRLGWVRFV